MGVLLSLIHISGAKYIEFERCNEDNDIEGVVKKLESEKYEVRYATALTELDVYKRQGQNDQL